MDRHPRQERRRLHPRPRDQRGPVDQPHRRPERDHRRRDREPGGALLGPRPRAARVPELGRRQGLGVRIRLTGNPIKSCVHWETRAHTRSQQVGKWLAEPETAGSAAGSTAYRTTGCPPTVPSHHRLSNWRRRGSRRSSRLVDPKPRRAPARPATETPFELPRLYCHRLRSPEPITIDLKPQKPRIY